MSYTYLQEQGEVSSVESFSDIPAYVLSRLNLTAEKSCCSANETESCQSSQSGTTCEHSTGNRGKEKSMSCAADFLAKTSALQETEKGCQEREVNCGQKWQESLPKSLALDFLRVAFLTVLTVGFLTVSFFAVFAVFIVVSLSVLGGSNQLSAAVILLHINPFLT